MLKTTKIGLFGLVLALGLGISILPAWAKDVAKNNLENIPQKNGIYDVPNHPNMKVRVFVHFPKMDAKPAPAPVCSLDDPNSGSLVSATYWHLPSNWNYTLNTASVPSSVKGSNLATIAANSFRVWTEASGNKVNITPSGTSLATKANSDDGINLIAWGVTPNNALGVTYTMYYTSGSLDGTVAGVDTILNKKFPWSWSYNPGGCNAKAYDAQDILTHEIGHWMGLGDHYTVDYANNTMYGYGSMGETKKNTLTLGDILGVQTVYMNR